jgi:hypothetical protein
MIRSRKIAPNTKLFAIGLLFTLACAALAALEVPIRRVERFRKLKVGSRVPQFAAVVAHSDVILGANRPPARFFVHVVSDRLPLTAYDTDFGAVGTSVMQLGGHMIGGSDSKVAGAFGIKIKKLKPWTLDASIAVIGDRDGIIRAIFVNVRPENLETVVRTARSLQLK